MTTASFRTSLARQATLPTSRAAWVAVLAVAACSSPPPQAPTATATAAPVATAAPLPAAPAARTPVPASPAAVPGAGSAANAALPAPPAGAQVPPTASVFFAFDDYTIGNEYFGSIERLGKFLLANPQAMLRIEGHADERGSHEYNLALGQRRAEAVVRALRTQGVRPSQMEAVSFGEERPSAAGHDEISWSKNRRADMVYRKQP